MSVNHLIIQSFNYKMEYELTRRDFVAGLGGLLGSLMINPLEVIAGYVQPAGTEEKERANCQLKRLEYLLNPPNEESYQTRDKTIKLKSDNNYFVLSAPTRTRIKESELFKIISYNQEKYAEQIYAELISSGTLMGNSLYLISRDYLKDEENKKRLEEAAKKGRLPAIYPSWLYNDGKVIPDNRVSVKPKSKEKEGSIISFAKKNGLKLSPDNKLAGLYLLFELPINTSKFVSPFEASRAFLKEGTAQWCEPNFIREIDLR